MMTPFLNNTKSLTGRLALFFISLSTVVAVYSYLIFFAALHVSEDRLSAQRITLMRRAIVLWQEKMVKLRWIH